jgi:TPR repeat protein
LSAVYYYGEIVEQDLKIAYYWILKSERNGYKKASEKKTLMMKDLSLSDIEQIEKKLFE